LIGKAQAKLEHEVILQSENSITWTFLEGVVVCDLQRAKLGSSLLLSSGVNHNILYMPRLTKWASLLWVDVVAK